MDDCNVIQDLTLPVIGTRRHLVAVAVDTTSVQLIHVDISGAAGSLVAEAVTDAQGAGATYPFTEN